jgi:hypothetical protein
MANPTYVLVKLLDPVGPDDAQNLAHHLVQTLEFADVESAQPCVVGVDWGCDPPSVEYFALVGEEVSLAPRAAKPSALSHLNNEAGARAWREGA